MAHGLLTGQRRKVSCECREEVHVDLTSKLKFVDNFRFLLSSRVRRKAEIAILMELKFYVEMVTDVTVVRHR